MVTVHYFFDPMCGWCYGATSLLEAIAGRSDIELKLHPGGMMANKAIEADFRHHILISDQRIAALTGVRFGEAYIQRVNSSDDLILDSYLTTRAIICAEQLGVAPLEMLKAIQHAHYFAGKQVHRIEVIEQLAVELGLDRRQWQQAMQSNQGAEQAKIDHTRSLMHELQLTGYPTLILENNGALTALPHSEYYGQPDAWRQRIERTIAPSSTQLSE
ncbi:protein-disulfide isomerase [Vibrio neptunius]|uniref:DsbA family protein n=1 Tax=Vibrio neptunius TaxID=170651 RepID=UPI0005FA7824|nr:DsbA family protein [Vibrio neptunius]KJY89402.1 protein-disulfide isomerase [Vibrio neptunius]